MIPQLWSWQVLERQPFLVQNRKAPRGFLYLAGVIPVKPSIEYEDCTTQLYLGIIS